MNRTFTPALDAGTLQRLEAYAAHFADDFNRPRQRAWCGVYLAGLLQDGERKSIEPLSRRVTLPATLEGTQDPDQGLQQFVSQSSWDEAAIGRRYRALMARTFARPAGVFVLDDTTFPKAGTHSVGVQRQYCGAIGQEGQLPGGRIVALRRPGRPRAVGPAPVPARELAGGLARGWTKPGCQRVNGGHFPRARSPWSCSTPCVPRTCLPGGVVVGESGYGVSGPLREGLAARGFFYVLGVTGEMVVFTQAPRWQAPGPSAGGRPRRRHRLEEDGAGPLSLRAVAAQTPLRKVTWREGTKGPMAGRFAWLRVWPAHGWAMGDCAREQPLWLLIEEQPDGTIKYAFSNLPADTSRLRAVRLWRERWKIEQGYQQMKEELGTGPLRGPLLARLPPSCRPGHARLRLFGAGTTPRQDQDGLEKKPAVPPGVITLPAIRRALQHFLAPLAKPDCPYCRPFILSDQLTE